MGTHHGPRYSSRESTCIAVPFPEGVKFPGHDQFLRDDPFLQFFLQAIGRR